MKLQTAPGTQVLHVEDDEYIPDENGQIDVPNEAHLRPLRAMGCSPVGDDAPLLSVITADETGGEPDTALLRENEQLRSQIGTLKDELEKVQGELTSARQVEDGLRDRIQELEAAAKAPPSPTETQTGAEGGGDSSDAPEGSEDAPEATGGPIKEVGGITVSDPAAFDDMEYNSLKEWLKVHEVHVPSNISKVNAIAACKDRFAELTAK